MRTPTPLVETIVSGLVKQAPARKMQDMVDTVMNRDLHPDADLPKGVLAGLAAGILGTVAKSVVQHFFPVSKPEAANLRTIHVGDTSLEINVDTTEWITGVVVGGVYGGAAELAPEVTLGQGLGLGTALYGLNTTEGELLDQDVEIRPREENESHELLGDLVYGLVVEFLRSNLRERLN